MYGDNNVDEDNINGDDDIYDDDLCFFGKKIFGHSMDPTSNEASISYYFMKWIVVVYLIRKVEVETVVKFGSISTKSLIKNNCQRKC